MTSNCTENTKDEKHRKKLMAREAEVTSPYLHFSLFFIFFEGKVFSSFECVKYRLLPCRAPHRVVLLIFSSLFTFPIEFFIFLPWS
jgi:hypothetical protein